MAVANRSQEFAYDDISRLIFSHGGYGDFSFSYNLVGDRTVRERTYDDNGTSIVDTHLYDYDPTTMRLSEVTSEQTNTALRTFSYAATGQVISDERTDALYTYGLNQNGRINTVSMAGASVATYTYDDDEQRIVKAITGQSPIHYIYDQDGRLIAEHDGDTGAVIREYMWLGMMPVATYAGTSGTGECDEDAIAALEQNIADITALITTRTTKAENLRTKITAVNTRITTKRDKIATYKAQIVVLKAKIANTNNTTRIANLRARIATKRARIQSLRTQIDTLKAKRKAHNKKLRKHERRIGILGQERTTLTIELEALQSQCEGGETTAGLYFLHADHLGKTQFATDTTGAIIWDGGITTPFGESLTLASAFTQNLMFPGQYADSETGLSHNWHRTYDPMLGRYLQSDPIGLAGGLNRYAYVGGNPVSYVDPTGLQVATPYAPGDIAKGAFKTVTRPKPSKAVPGAQFIAIGYLMTAIGIDAKVVLDHSQGYSHRDAPHTCPIPVANDSDDGLGDNPDISDVLDYVMPKSEKRKYCAVIKDQCIEKCLYLLGGNRMSQGNKYTKCVKECERDNGC